MRGVTIQLDVPRKIRFDGAAIMRLEELMGESVISMMRTFKNRDLPMRAIVNMVTAGVYSELPEATPEYIVKLMEDNGKGDSLFEKLSYYAMPALDALSDAIGTREKNPQGGGQKAPKETKAVGRGKSSKSSDSPAD